MDSEGQDRRQGPQAATGESMNGYGKPFVFLTRSVPGSPPLLWVGTQKFELDRNTALHWANELMNYVVEELREVEREKR
jgi:hypothetical protein